MEEIILIHRSVFAILILNDGRGRRDGILITLILVEDCLEVALVQNVQHARILEILLRVVRHVAEAI